MGITLLEMLSNSGLITMAQQDEALQNRVLFGGKIGTSLIELGFIAEETLARFLSGKLAVPYVHPDHLRAIPPQVIALISHELALKYRAIPIRLDGRRLYLVMADPADLIAIDEISFITGYVIKPLVTPEVRLMQALARYYGMEIDPRYLRIIAVMEKREAETRAAALAAQPPEPVPLPAPQPETFGAPPLPEPPEPEAAPPAQAESPVEEADLVESDEWVELIELYSIDAVSRELARAEGREEISDALIRYLGQEFRRVALFVVRGESAYGWRAAVERFEVDGFDHLAVPLTEPSVLKTVAGGGGIFLGPVPETPVNREILAAVGSGNPSASLVLPLIVASRVVALLYVEEGREPLAAMTADLQKLMAKAALAFEILIFRDRILSI
ncbi:MAG TPA: hypothetical protein VI298_16415 [Geobacteraceae bacterium]